jgi:hypothetical protein
MIRKTLGIVVVMGVILAGWPSVLRAQYQPTRGPWTGPATQPGLPFGPGQAGRPLGSPNDQDDKDRRSGFNGFHHIYVHVPYHGPSGSGSPPYRPSPGSFEGKVPSSAKASGTRGWGKGIFAGIGGAIAAAFAALFGRKKNEGI